MKCTTHFTQIKDCQCEEHTAFRKAVAEWVQDRVRRGVGQISSALKYPDLTDKIAAQSNQEWRDSFTDDEWEHA